MVWLECTLGKGTTFDQPTTNEPQCAHATPVNERIYGVD